MPRPFHASPAYLPLALVQFLHELGFAFIDAETAFYFEGKKAHSPFYLCVRRTETPQCFSVQAYLPEVFRSYEWDVRWGSAVADMHRYLEDHKLPVTSLLRRRRLQALRTP